MNILYSPRNEYIATLKVSREMENHLLCIRQTQSPAQRHISDEKSSNAKFRIVHHIKNALILSIFMIFLLYLSESDNNYTVCIKCQIQTYSWVLQFGIMVTQSNALYQLYSDKFYFLCTTKSAIIQPVIFTVL